MKLSVILKNSSLDSVLNDIENHFGERMRAIQMKMSMFEQYEIRPVRRVFVPKIWSYRIVCKGGEYQFGTIEI